MAEPKPGPYVGMDEYSTEGAMLSAVYFTDLYRYAFVTGEVTDLEAMSEDGCVFCDSVITNATTLHSSNGWVTPWEETVGIISVDESADDPAIYYVRMFLETGPSTMYSGDGAVLHDYVEAYDQNLTLEMRWSGQAWHVTGGASL